ncbi:hypothetical protein OQA88_3094 [Cercophora sp. LCS_1]
MVEHDPCLYQSNPDGRANALWRTHIADLPGDRAAPVADALFIETWYDRVGWQRPPPNLTSKGIWETATLEGDKGQPQSDMVAHCVQLRAETAEYKDHVARASLSQLLKDGVAGGIEAPKAYGRYLRRIRKVCAHRALCVTQKGYMGLVPWNAREGYTIIVLQGGKTPFTLRYASMGGNLPAFHVVGEAYVHSIMGGEAVSGAGGEWQELDLV